MWATISLEHNDVVRYESTKIDYIRWSNIKEILGREGSWLDSRSSCLRTRQGIKSKRSSVIIISGSCLDQDVMFISLEQDVGLSISSKTSGCHYEPDVGLSLWARRRVVVIEQDVGLSVLSKSSGYLLPSRMRCRFEFGKSLRICGGGAVIDLVVNNDVVFDGWSLWTNKHTILFKCYEGNE